MSDSSQIWPSSMCIRMNLCCAPGSFAQIGIADYAVSQFSDVELNLVLTKSIYFAVNCHKLIGAAGRSASVREHLGRKVKTVHSYSRLIHSNTKPWWGSWTEKCRPDAWGSGSPSAVILRIRLYDTVFFSKWQLNNMKHQRIIHIHYQWVCCDISVKRVCLESQC